MLARADKLKYHIMCKQSKQELKCEHCDHLAATYTPLKRQKIIEHGGVRFPCKLCDYKAKEKTSLKYHMQEIHK